MFLPTPVAAPSKAWVCARSLAGIAGSNPDGVHGYVSLVSIVCCAGRGLCDGPILLPEGQYRVFLSMSVISCNNNPLLLQ